MDINQFHDIPADRRADVGAALASCFGEVPVSPLCPVAGGASGARLYSFEHGGVAYLLRLEGRRGALRNPHQYVCMRTAAYAGIAPALHHVDEANGVTVMDFIARRPLNEYPGGPANLAGDLGRLVARLQRTPPFPELYDYPVVLDRMLGRMRQSGSFATGLLDPHVTAFERIRAAYPWDKGSRTSSHNDPNPNNVLFDGQRLWLIDWETSYRNEPLIDLAILADNFAPIPELQDALLEGWQGGPVDRALAARLTILRPLTRLYYAGLMFGVAASAGGPSAMHTDLQAPTPAEFRAAIAAGQLKVGAPDTIRTFARVLLAGFLSGASGPVFEEALMVLGGD